MRLLLTLALALAVATGSHSSVESRNLLEAGNDSSKLRRAASTKYSHASTGLASAIGPKGIVRTRSAVVGRVVRRSDVKAPKPPNAAFGTKMKGAAWATTHLGKNSQVSLGYRSGKRQKADENGQMQHQNPGKSRLSRT
ncbi:hypothetical protein Ae201684P_007839 [Aphanomyces euteiches]|nr:hypothetical protein Ae201684P_007839 [Aphanomyces euteiches]